MGYDALECPSHYRWNDWFWFWQYNITSWWLYCTDYQSLYFCMKMMFCLFDIFLCFNAFFSLNSSLASAARSHGFRYGSVNLTWSPFLVKMKLPKWSLILVFKGNFKYQYYLHYIFAVNMARKCIIQSYHIKRLIIRRFFFLDASKEKF